MVCATLVYTAPALPSGPAVDDGTTVDIAVTPMDSKNFQNESSRFVTIRLVPPGVVIPADGLKAAFTFTPSGAGGSSERGVRRVDEHGAVEQSDRVVLLELRRRRDRQRQDRDPFVQSPRHVRRHADDCGRLQQDRDDDADD